MLNFFKSFGKGILYVLVLPFLLVGLAIYGVVAIFVFIFLAIKGLVLFFTGRSLFEDLPEDKEAKRRLAVKNGEIIEESKQEETVQEEPQRDIIQEQLARDEEINNDPFYVPEYMKEEILPQEELKPVEEEPQPISEPEPVPTEEKPVEREEIPTKSSQNTNILEINEEDEDDSNDSGVTIHFD